MITAQSRIQVVDTPLLQPGTCSLCGSASDNKRKFIDFGKQLDWYGAVYICSICLREAAEAIGFIPVAGFDNLHNAHRELQIKFDQLETKYKSVENALRSLLDGHHSECTNVDDFVSSVVSATAESNSIERAIEGSTKGNSEAEQSTSIEGSDDLFDASDFE